MDTKWHDFRDAKVGDPCWSHRYGDGVLIEASARYVRAAFPVADTNVGYRVDGTITGMHDGAVRLFKQPMKWVPQ